VAGAELGTIGEATGANERPPAASNAALLESVTGAVFAFDRDWRYTFVNAAAERLLGRSRELLLGRECWQAFPELRAHGNAAKAEYVMRSRQLLVWESLSSVTGGWVQWRAYPMLDGGISVFVEDIDSRVQAQRAVSESEARFRALAELVPALIWMLNSKGELAWCSQSWLTYSGPAQHADVWQVIHPDDRERTRLYMRTSIDTGAEVRIENRLRNAAGEYRWFVTSGRPIVGGAGRDIQWVAAAFDIQEQRDSLAAERRARAEAENALQAAENAREELRGIVAAIPSAVAVTRGYDPVFELVNPAYEALIGQRSVVGRAVADVFPYVANNGFIDILRQIERTGEAVRLPERRVTYDREDDGVMYEGYFSSFLAPLRDRNGVINGVVTSGMEVTDLVRQRERIQALVDEAEAGRALLEQARAELETRIEKRTAELARSNAALAAEIETRVRAEALRGDLLRRLATAREDEQRRTARDLHDQVGQSVSALMLAIKAACDAETLPEGAAARLADALRLAEDLGRDVHDLATRLRPAALDDIGLHAALRQLTSTWSRRFSLSVDLQASWLQRERLPADVETVLYRVVQEALTNVARHAHAQHVSVVVERHAGYAIAVIEDDGVGFDVGTPRPDRLGLVGMTERVTLVGGTLEIESGPAGGVTVIARVPVSQADAP
jgi:PAS domain S-box-containing protein